MTNEVITLEAFKSKHGFDADQTDERRSPVLADLLEQVEAFLRRFVVMDPDACTAVTLWVAHVYAFRAWDTTPYLAVTSATKRSGKSRLLEVLELLLGEQRALFTANISPASLYRVVDRSPGRALLIDEQDRIGNKERQEELSGLFNSGWRRRGGSVVRVVGQGTSMRPENFATFSPKVLAGIGTLPDTVADRSIPIRMRPRLRSEVVERLRDRDAEEQAVPIRVELSTWASEDVVEQLRRARPALPDAIHDRAQDVWEPLLALADSAGGAWPDRARAAAVRLGEASDAISDQSTGLLALEHVRDTFHDRGNPEAIWSEDLLAALVARDDGPWAERWGGYIDTGRPQSAAQRLARILHPFDVSPRQVRIGGKTKKGYVRTDLADAWARHLTATGRAETTGTGETSLVGTTSGVSAVTAVSASRSEADGVEASPTVKVPSELVTTINDARRAGFSDERIAWVLNESRLSPPTGESAWSEPILAGLVPVMHS